MTRDIIFWGATGHSKVLHELIQGTNLKLVALVDQRQLPSPFPALPVLLGEQGLDEWLSTRADLPRPLGAIAIGGAHGNDRLSRQQALMKRGIETIKLVHRTAFVAGDAFVGEGSQVLAHSSLCTCVHVGKAVIINTAASIDHDCVIGDGAHIGPGAHLAGEILIGACAFVGVGAIILPRINIGARSVVGGGAVVTRDVPPDSVVAGNPARKLERGKSEG